MQAKLLGEEGRPRETIKEGQQRDLPGNFKPRTKLNYGLDEAVSALQKEIRRGNEDKALFWAIELVESGYALYFWSRLGVIVPEDIGLADPMAIVVVNTCAQMFERRVKKWSEGPFTYELISQAILYVCRAPKSGEVGYAAYAIQNERDLYKRRDPVPDYALDMHTEAGRERIKNNGMTKEDEEVWWFTDLSFRAKLAKGNRWIRRFLSSVKDLGRDASEELIQKELKDYGETEANQHRPWNQVDKSDF